MTLDELLTALHAATGSDRELDRHLHILAFPLSDDFQYYGPRPFYTHSIDDALAFAEKMLPGWDVIISSKGWSTVWESDHPMSKTAKGEGKNPALCILIAVVSALKERGT